ncbi:MAG: hypothetical protein J7559_13945 [Cohnella sp.]|nr:hypothetical protein [Cohnella sp.]
MISIKLDEVVRRGQELFKLFRRLDVVNHDLSSVGSRIDERILSRRSIAWRLRDNRLQIAGLVNRLAELEQFMRVSMEEYRKADAAARQNKETLSSFASDSPVNEAAIERAVHMNDSSYDFINWMTNGVWDILHRSFGLDEPLSKECLMSRLGVALSLIGDAGVSPITACQNPRDEG